MSESEIELLKAELAAKQTALDEAQHKLSEAENELVRLKKTIADIIEAQERGHSFWRRITGR
jgi:chromosome segregation ATPase